MNTQTISQFELLDTDLLAAVEGGKNNWAANVTGVLAAGVTGVTGGF